MYNDILNELNNTDSQLPPYYVELDDGKWYLEQDELKSNGKIEFINKYSDGNESVFVDVPSKGSFKYAHLKQ